MYQLTDREKGLCKEIVDCAYRVHSELGPGLLEKIYEACFCYELTKKGIVLNGRFIFRFITMV